MTAIRSKEKAGNQVVFECIFCGEESDVSCIDWSLQRSMHCPSCDGDGVIQGPDDLEPCKLCKWSDNELAYLPGTQVIFIPTQAGTNALHDDCEHGVVTSVNSTNIFVRYIDDTGLEIGCISIGLPPK
jgi:ribosomal protein L37AE/L43A